MDPLLKAKMLLDTVYDKMQESYLFNKEKIDLVSSMFSDLESKLAYEREITFKILNPIVGLQNAQNISKSGIDPKSFEELCQKALKDPNLPKMPSQVHPGALGWCLAATYYLLQYQYKDIVKPHKDDIVLDCGACYGDTSIWFLRNGAKEVHAFEIEKNNIVLLQEVLNLNKVADKIHFIPKALGKAAGELWFHNGGVLGGSISETRRDGDNYRVPVTTIDDYCAETGIHPNFIKMDIEGAEVDALKGAKNTICTYKPDLTICLYHQPTHMWDIPLMIKEMCPEYRFYCKKSHFQVECVLLATYRG